MTTTTTGTAGDIDLFSDANLTDPYPVYTLLRGEGPAVWLDRVRSWAIPRYDDVRATLEDWQRFTTSAGVGLNDAINEQIVGTVLASDPPQHQVLRSVLSERLGPRAIRGLQPEIQARADTLVDQLAGTGTFDAVTELARVYPFEVISDLIGLPQQVRPRILGWADGVFDTLGPENERTFAAFGRVQELFTWLFELDPADLTAGSMGRAIYEAADAGVIDPASAPLLLAAYVSAGMDTTISAIGSAVMLFAAHPDQWAAVRADRSLVPNAFNEVIRLESPVQVFTRVTTTDVHIDGVPVPAGDRVIVMYGCANRDERHFGPDAAAFDVTRDTAADQLAFGMGLHGCAGQGLARLEAHAILNALADRVERFEVTGPARRHLNNCTRGLESLPVTVHNA